MGKKRKNKNNQVPFTFDYSEQGQTIAVIDDGMLVGSYVCTAPRIQISNL